MINFDFSQDKISVGICDTKKHTKEKFSTDRTAVCYEFEYIMENGGTSFVNEKPYPNVKNMLLCIKPGMVRHTIFPLKCLFIKFTTESADIIKCIEKIDTVIMLNNSDKVYGLFTELLTLYNTEDAELLIFSKFTELLYILNEESRVFGNSTVEKAKAYMNENYAQKLTVENIAEYVHFNPVYFQRIFKKETGKTPIEYIIDIRIDNAKKQLHFTDKTVGEISLDCGFESQAYFGKVFKKKTGMSAKTFRKINMDKFLN